MENKTFKINSRYIERLFAVVILMACAAIFISTSNYPIISVSEGGNAGFYPRVIALILGLLAVMWLVGTFKTQEKQQDDEEKVDLPLGKKAFVLLWIVIFIFALPTLVSFVGFWTCTFVFLLLTIIGISEQISLKSIGKAVAITLLAVAVMIAIFQYGSHVPFPRGSIITF